VGETVLSTTAKTKRHIFVPVSSQDLDFQHHMVFLCSARQRERWLFILLILVELLTIII